jgi:hypothetical protein
MTKELYLPTDYIDNYCVVINNGYYRVYTNRELTNYTDIYYSENSNQLEKLVKYFTPEEETYYKNLYNFSAPGFILTAIVILVFFIYLVKRFLLKGCQGPKNVVQSYHYTTYFLIGFGIVIGLIFHICYIYNAAVSK